MAGTDDEYLVALMKQTVYLFDIETSKQKKLKN
jgi:hypothetical protein